MIPLYKQNKNKQDKLNIVTGIEYETGRIIDGQKEYAKRVDCGFLNSGTISVPYNIQNIKLITKFEGNFYNINSKSTYIIPRSYPSNAEAYNVDCNISIPNGTIILTSGTNYDGSTFKAIVTIYYIKS